MNTIKAWHESGPGFRLTYTSTRLTKDRLHLASDSWISWWWSALPGALFPFRASPKILLECVARTVFGVHSAEILSNIKANLNGGKSKENIWIVVLYQIFEWVSCAFLYVVVRFRIWAVDFELVILKKYFFYKRSVFFDV